MIIIFVLRFSFSLSHQYSIVQTKKYGLNTEGKCRESNQSYGLFITVLQLEKNLLRKDKGLRKESGYSWLL